MYAIVPGCNACSHDCIRLDPSAVLVFAIQLDHFQYVVTVLTLTLLSLFLSIDLYLSCVHNIRAFGLYGKHKCKTWKISKISTSNHDFIYFLRFHHASVTRNTLRTFHFPL